MALSGYNYDAFMAENLIAGYKTAEEVFEGWHTSPGHDADILNSNQWVIGIARIYVPGSTYNWYWTTDFGSDVDHTSPRGEVPPLEQQAP
ncbi:MAG: CAP domain-containing protein [Actinomycetota bacterium]|nr:CAP domain-containing protein [Actinomycetota bacterium]